MKTLQEIKHIIAIQNGYSSWAELLSTFHKGDHEEFHDKVSVMYANNKLQYAADNMDWSNCYDGGCHCGRDRHEQSILSLKEEEQ